MRYWKAFALTLLFLILIPQSFIITASLNSAPIEERKTGRKYPAEVVSKKVLESVVENGEVSTFYEYTVRTSRETIIKMINEDWETYEYIKYFKGKSAADEWRSQQIEAATNGPEYVESTIGVNKHGEKCITYGKMLYGRIWPWEEPHDPVNINFVGSGYVDTVHAHMLNDLDILWYDAIGDSLYGWIDNTAHGGGAWWETQSYQVDYPPGAITVRNHARLYWAPADPHEFGQWSMGGVHHEHTEWFWHVVDDWDNIRNSLAADFADESFCSGAESHWEDNEGWWQNVYHDGYSIRIRLTS